MGADEFQQYADGADPAEAFRDACEEARHEYGHRGYTGTLAEKDDYIVIEGKPTPRELAEALASRLVRDDDPRIRDKWGPAGAIAVAADGSTGIAGWLFFGLASC
ncbi:hypothetical protein ABZ671_01225 [Micromonospora sp. NPDC006766]|uniref:hypothetical protein n=1 Tax=Micromonospora sp. NPDC006766 TaxID=3154778 RepID=UPI0033CDF3ED